MSAAVRLVQSEDYQVVENAFNKGVLIRGGIPEGSIVFALARAAEQHYRGITIKPENIILINDKDEIEYRSQGSSRLLTAAIDEKAFSRALELRWGESLDNISRSVFPPADNSKSNNDLAKELQSFFNEETYQYPDSKGSTEDRLIDIFFQYARQSGDMASSSLYRHRLAKQAEEYIREHFRHPVSMTSLCNELNARERTIQQGFRERFGMSFNEYVKMLRLNAVRKALVSASREDSVTAIALDFGFNHMGRFSAAYKKHFGESPSATFSRTDRDKHQENPGI